MIRVAVKLDKVMPRRGAYRPKVWLIITLRFTFTLKELHDSCHSSSLCFRDLSVIYMCNYLIKKTCTIKSLNHQVNPSSYHYFHLKILWIPLLFWSVKNDCILITYLILFPDKYLYNLALKNPWSTKNAVGVISYKEL